MGILIGFKRMKIQPFSADGTKNGDVIVIEGKEGEGATQEADISGLSSDPVKSYGSNVAYYVSQKGTGDVKADYKLLDVPSQAEDRMLGYETDSEFKAQFIGENTEAPYCGVVMESEDTQGNVALFGFFKGKFNKSNVKIETKKGGNVEPEGEAYTYSAVASDLEGKSKGNTMVKYLGDKAGAAKVEALVLRSTDA